jgi:hypothetical protein
MHVRAYKYVCERACMYATRSRSSFYHPSCSHAAGPTQFIWKSLPSRQIMCFRGECDRKAVVDGVCIHSPFISLSLSHSLFLSPSPSLSPARVLHLSEYHYRSYLYIFFFFYILFDFIILFSPTRGDSIKVSNEICRDKHRRRFSFFYTCTCTLATPSIRQRLRHRQLDGFVKRMTVDNKCTNGSSVCICSASYLKGGWGNGEKC